METEIELKFFVSPDYSTVLQEKIADAKILQHNQRTLGNTYFDTEEHWLRQHDIGLRIRRFDNVYVQTVKTAGRVVAGLHQRPEYNAEHNCNDPDLSLHPEDIWPDGMPLATLQQALNPLFSTDFTREQWLVAMPDGSQIELAFDMGTVTAGEQSEPICEVELELKSGQTDALFTLARQLSEGGAMRLGNLSKAARGYRLATGYQGDAVRELPLVATKENDSIETCFINSLEHALNHWHYHEQIYVERDEIAALKQIYESVSFIRQVLTVFKSVIPKRASALIRQELKWLEQELVWLHSYQHVDALLDDKAWALRKLDAKKPLVQALQSYQETLPSRASMLELIQSARYVGLLLDLSRWLLTRGWQPFLDDKSRETMQQSVESFAQVQLDNTWQAICVAFPNGSELSKDDYITQYYRLRRNLFTGVSFANIFNHDLRQSFRLPWEDLMQGIDDLMALEPLEKLVGSLSDEENEQLARWLSRRETSILNAMEQTRQIGMDVQPYWRF